MVKQILTGAGFVENKTFKETRFLNPPKSTYAVYMDSYNRNNSIHFFHNNHSFST